jgi:pimeloyl-ACP methyl ester carboxylesterase
VPPDESLAPRQRFDDAKRDSQVAWVDSSPHKSGFVRINGVQLNYLEWSSTGLPLILIHGLADNPHVFDDIATAFTDDFRVIAYARRYHGKSDHRGQFDTVTLVEDLRCLMDALEIPVADLVGWSMGGNEITGMAVAHPQRVRKLVYLDGGYDYADPDFRRAIEVLPSSLLQMPESALATLEAYLLFQKTMEYITLDDMRRVEAHLRESILIHPNGSVRPRVDTDLLSRLFLALFSAPLREYARVRSPALAIYATLAHELSITDTRRRAESLRWELHYMSPFREKSKERIRREMPNVEVVNVSGTHNGFILTSRRRVVELMREFLLGPKAASD